MSSASISQVSVVHAMELLHSIPILDIVNSTATSSDLEKRVSTFGWVTLGFTNLGADVLGGLYVFQNGCVAVSMIPGIATFTGPACVVAAVASMILFAGLSGAAWGGVEGIGNTIGGLVSHNEKRDLFSEEDFLKYSHITNLTDWYQVLRGSGYNITLDPHNAATYYDLEGSIIGVNSSSVVYNEGVRTAYIHHGTNASMIHFDLESAKDTGDIGKRDVDPYGNGYDDEGFAGNEGFKGQWCHQYGNSETLNPVNDWSMMNQLVQEETGDGQTDHYNLWFFGAYDNNHDGAQIAGIEIEAERVIYQYNEEWSEEGICDTEEYMVEE